MCATQIIEMKAFLQNALWARKGFINCHFLLKESAGSKNSSQFMRLRLALWLSDRMVEITHFDLNKPTVL